VLPCDGRLSICKSKLNDDESSTFDDAKKPKRMISRLSQEGQDQD